MCFSGGFNVTGAFLGARGVFCAGWVWFEISVSWVWLPWCLVFLAFPPDQLFSRV